MFGSSSIVAFAVFIYYLRDVLWQILSLLDCSADSEGF